MRSILLGREDNQLFHVAHPDISILARNKGCILEHRVYMLKESVVPGRGRKFFCS
jgi:hypothetical protein